MCPSCFAIIHRAPEGDETGTEGSLPRMAALPMAALSFPLLLSRFTQSGPKQRRWGALSSYPCLEGKGRVREQGGPLHLSFTLRLRQSHDPKAVARVVWIAPRGFSRSRRRAPACICLQGRNQPLHPAAVVRPAVGHGDRTIEFVYFRELKNTMPGRFCRTSGFC